MPHVSPGSLGGAGVGAASLGVPLAGPWGTSGVSAIHAFNRGNSGIVGSVDATGRVGGIYCANGGCSNAIAGAGGTVNACVALNGIACSLHEPRAYTCVTCDNEVVRPQAPLADGLGGVSGWQLPTGGGQSTRSGEAVVRPTISTVVASPVASTASGSVAGSAHSSHVPMSAAPLLPDLVAGRMATPTAMASPASTSTVMPPVNGSILMTSTVTPPVNGYITPVTPYPNGPVRQAAGQASPTLKCGHGNASWTAHVDGRELAKQSVGTVSSAPMVTTTCSIGDARVESQGVARAELPMGYAQRLTRPMAMAVMPTLSEGWPPMKMHLERPCTACRSAKIKCNREYPCRRCHWLGIACEVPPTVQRGRPSNRAKKEAMEAKALVAAQMQESTTQEASGTVGEEIDESTDASTYSTDACTTGSNSSSLSSVSPVAVSEDVHEEAEAEPKLAAATEAFERVLVEKAANGSGGSGMSAISCPAQVPAMYDDWPDMVDIMFGDFHSSQSPAVYDTFSDVVGDDVFDMLLQPPSPPTSPPAATTPITAPPPPPLNVPALMVAAVSVAGFLTVMARPTDLARVMANVPPMFDPVTQLVCESVFLTLISGAICFCTRSMQRLLWLAVLMGSHPAKTAVLLFFSDHTSIATAAANHTLLPHLDSSWSLCLRLIVYLGGTIHVVLAGSFQHVVLTAICAISIDLICSSTISFTLIGDNTLINPCILERCVPFAGGIATAIMLLGRTGWDMPQPGSFQKAIRALPQSSFFEISAHADQHALRFNPHMFAWSSVMLLLFGDFFGGMVVPCSVPLRISIV
uniref:Zn(2)-C6 fungal-type domain-containing protein n=1 Tax=Haptolina brevifila TaxID=156173 RepID=A0A7S2GPT2_9EUKA